MIRQRRAMHMKTSLKNRLASFETFSPSYQVTQLAVSREAMLILKRENRHVEVQEEIVRIIAFHSRQLKIWSFHLAVVPGWQSNVQERVVILLIKPIFLDVAVAVTILVT